MYTAFAYEQNIVIYIEFQNVNDSGSKQRSFDDFWFSLESHKIKQYIFLIF